MNWTIERKKKEDFIRFFDGVYNQPPIIEGQWNTFEMGVCKLTFNRKTNTLTVWLRRPGLLIGQGGKTYEAVKKFLDCNLNIKEVILTQSKKSV